MNEKACICIEIKTGYADEYIRRHREVFPELLRHLSSCGIKDYSIFIDHQSNQLFGYQIQEDNFDSYKLLEDPIIWKWWAFMSDIMETNPDNSPVERSLKEVFHLD